MLYSSIEITDTEWTPSTIDHVNQVLIILFLYLIATFVMAATHLFVLKPICSRKDCDQGDARTHVRTNITKSWSMGCRVDLTVWRVLA